MIIQRFFPRALFLIAALFLSPILRAADVSAQKPSDVKVAPNENALDPAANLKDKIPARDPAAKPGMVDLTAYYNAVLTETWHPGNHISLERRNDLSNMPRGLQKFVGIEFDVRGLIQLLGRGPKGWGGVFPEQVEGIKIGKSAKVLHFLHGTGYQAKDGTTIGYYVVNYVSGPERKIPIIYGKDVRDWWYWQNEPQKAD
ncbi:MAG: hypothetical protein JWM04_931, partial [Verrucomicrobiales bacterium]|nr:hypothetical protein [Verrucomicrobiales bacterium]